MLPEVVAEQNVRVRPGSPGVGCNKCAANGGVNFEHLEVILRDRSPDELLPAVGIHESR